MLEPQWQLGDDRFGVQNGVDRNVITLERFDKGFCHSVGLRAADRRRARLDSDVHQQRFRVLCNETRAVVGEPFNRLGKGVDATEAVLDGCDDKVLNVFALDALIVGDMGDGFTITAVESKGNADFLCVVAANIKAVEHQRRFCSTATLPSWRRLSMARVWR